MLRTSLARSLSTTLTLAAMLLGAAACGGGGGDSTSPPPPPPAPTVQAIILSPTTATLTAVGQTATLTAQVQLSNGAAGTQAVTWSSSNPAVATVSAGTVTAVGSGTTTITAAVGSVSAQAVVTVAIPVVQSVAITPATATLVSLGATTRLTAAVLLSNGAAGTQTPTWSSSDPSVVTVAGGTVTAVGNGTATITAAVGSVTGTATVTVAQAVASVRLLPTDTVVKSPAQLRGAALDARGNVIAGAALQYTSVAPAIASVSGAGALTPLRTGVGRVTVSAGGFTATAIVRSVVNVRAVGDLYPLFEFTASAGQRRALSDVSQAHADARADIMGRVWSYLETVLPSSGSAQTDMLFTTWPEIWTEASPFCGGVLFPNQVAWQACASPYWTHLFIPGTTPNDFQPITRFLARQFLLASMTASGAFPWFLTGYPQWLAGGAFQGAVLVPAVSAVTLADFRSGDTQNLLAPLETLVRTNSTTFFENLPQRTPVAVRGAQSTLFLAYLDAQYPTVIPAILARIRATPGAAFTNDLLLQEITTRTGRTLAQLDTEYLAYARALRP